MSKSLFVGLFFIRYMNIYRNAKEFIEDWLTRTDRKPLVIRGARQVGKTWLVRHFKHPTRDRVIELNFEKQPQLKSLFSSNNPAAIIENLESSLNTTIDIDRSILFLDEIQAAPEVLAKLRWFYEDCPRLAVVAAGSLLEFVLDKHEFSMPVGRINYLHLEPLSFEEFLMASDNHKLWEYIQKYELTKTIPDMIHQQLMQILREYIFVGGLPEAVASWTEKRSAAAVNEIHHNLLATYRDDFSKYSGRISTERLEEVLQAVPRLLSKKFVYSRVNPNVQAASLKQAFELLCKARLCHQVHCTAANGLPLRSEIKENTFKAILIDCGLVSSLLGLKLQNLSTFDDIHLNNHGGLSEQLVGQLLRTIEPIYIEPQLYYWTREKKGGEAEIDYLIQHSSHIIPIEVKAGATGTLRSLHHFVAQKKVQWAVRINSDYPSVTDINMKTTTGEAVKYKLLSIPFYLTGQTHRLLNTCAAHL